MSETFQFGPRGSLPQGDKLQHYRVQIKKLKKYNQEIQKAYSNKIQVLENQINQLKSKGGTNKGVYQSGANINNQILKRDKEINRLMEENQKLKRQNKYNPDRQLLNRRKEIFDSVADKDAEILRLKKNLHELESKYDGRFFNQPKIKHQYNMLLKENQRIKKELQFHYDQRKEKKKQPIQVNSDLLDGIRYKKQYELVSKENELLKNMMKKSEEEKDQNMQKSPHIDRIANNSQIELLRKQLRQSEERNRMLMEELRRNEQNSNKKEDYRNTNFKEISRISIFDESRQQSKPEQNFSRLSRQYENPHNNESSYIKSSHKKPIFGNQYASDSKYTRNRQVQQPEDREDESKVETYQNKKRISKYQNFDLGQI